MKDDFKNIYQFKISMKGIVPQIWRRIQVPETYTFLELHNAIQAAMNWEDYHLHEFEMQNPKTGMLDRIGTKVNDYEVFSDESLVPEKRLKSPNILRWKIRVLFTPTISGTTGR